MLAYAVALDVAQPWLGVAVSAPPWFGSDEASSVQGADLDAAYSGFMHALQWGLTGRSGDAADAAAGLGYELARIHRSKLEGAGCRAAGAFGGCGGARRAAPGAGRSEEPSLSAARGR